MDSTTNLHHHHHHQVHEEELIVESSTSSASLPFADNHHAWRTPSFFLNNNGNIHATCGNGDEAPPISLNNPIIQEMGFPWPNDISINQNHHHHQQLIADRIKEEPSSSTSSDHHHHHHDNSTFMKFSDMLSTTSTSPSDEMLLLKNTLSTSYKNLHQQQQQPSSFLPSLQYQNQNAHNNNNNNKGINTTFSQIFPSVNISNMNNNNSNNNNGDMSSATMSSSSNTIDQMASNVPGGFDLFATARLLSGETSIDQSASSNNNNDNNNLLELFEGSPQFSIDHDLQHCNDLKLCNNIANNDSSFNNNGGQSAESKNYIMEQQQQIQQSTTHQMPIKKQRFEPRASCPPLKVRKEKLGDRIAALQQLVSPFGKTDTASVLTEAVGYIKFLQNQVETLSVPYMKLASRSKSSNNQRADDEYCESEEQKITDLKSRGLCLVPTSCMSYINIPSDPIHGGVWPPNFNPTSGF